MNKINVLATDQFLKKHLRVPKSLGGGDTGTLHMRIRKKNLNKK